MTEQHVLLTDLLLGESPRWHDGRLWFADWGAQHLVAVDPEAVGAGEVGVDCLGYLPVQGLDVLVLGSPRPPLGRECGARAAAVVRAAPGTARGLLRGITREAARSCA